MKGKMRIMGVKGDVAVTWDTQVESEVEVARTKFVEDMKKGRVHFQVMPDKSSQVMKSFDPNVEEIVTISPIAGG